MIEEFVEKLKRSIEIERKAQIEAMLNEIKRLSGEERERRGNAILNLNGKIVDEEFGYKLVKYGRRRKIVTNINVGDLVLVSRGNPLKSDLVGVVAEKGERYLVVALENVPNWALKDVRIDLYANDVTFRRWLENLENLGESGFKALKLALGLEKPKKCEKVEFEPFDRSLNHSQIRAVSLALGSDFFLIHGPFGTGKTRTLAEVVRQEVKRGNRVLATAESNVAVDNLVELLKDLNVVRLGHPSRVTQDLRSKTLSARVREHEMYGEVEELRRKAERLMGLRERFRKPTPALRRGLSDDEILELAEKKRGARGVSWKVVRSMAEWIKLNRLIDEILERARRMEENIAKEIVESADVVLATNSTAFTIDCYFDVAVIDEATQSTIPSVLIPINKADKFVLAGDHKQLPPTVLKAEELKKTLFEILIEMYVDHSVMLEVQYRMNEKLMDFPNREFYDGKLKAHESVRNITLKDLGVKNARWRVLDPKEVLVFIDTSKCPNRWERQRRGSTSRENELEARIVKRVVEGLKRIGVQREWIGVITPYDDQVDLLRTLVDVEVNTVDGYQGREKEVVIVSFVRSNRRGDIGFLEDLRRLNVALTRAKRKLVLIGDSKTLSSHETYSRLIGFVKKEGFFVSYC